MAKTANRGAVGAVCRAHDGSYLGASAVAFEGVTHPGCLEAMACREALALVEDLYVGDVTVASDCMEVVKGLQERSMGLFGHVLREVADTSRLRGGVTFCHEGRSSNHEAHTLARLATSLPAGRHVWLGVRPDGLNLPVNGLVSNE